MGVYTNPNKVQNIPQGGKTNMMLLLFWWRRESGRIQSIATVNNKVRVRVTESHKKLIGWLKSVVHYQLVLMSVLHEEPWIQARNLELVQQKHNIIFYK